jgi:hypothetical protein
MQLPTLWLFATTLSEADSVTMGLVGGIVLVALAWGEARVHIASLREWRREAEVKIASQAAQIAAMEVRESRTVARLDHLTEQLSRMDGKLDRLLARNAVA